MPFNPQTHHRRSIRLQEFHYSDAGAYFVTICAIEMRCLFGEVEVGTVRLNDAGLIIQECWDAMPEHFPHVELDAFVIMPNHLHGIVVLNDGKINGPVAVT